METIKIGKFLFKPEESALSYEGEKPGEPMELIPKENALLLYLCRHANQFVSKQEVLLEIWRNDDFLVGRRADVYITRLRKRLAADPTVKIESIDSEDKKGWQLTGMIEAATPDNE